MTKIRRGMKATGAVLIGFGGVLILSSAFTVYGDVITNEFKCVVREGCPGGIGIAIYGEYKTDGCDVDAATGDCIQGECGLCVGSPDPIRFCLYTGDPNDTCKLKTGQSTSCGLVRLKPCIAGPPTAGGLNGCCSADFGYYNGLSCAITKC